MTFAIINENYLKEEDQENSILPILAKMKPSLKNKKDKMSKTKITKQKVTKEKLLRNNENIVDNMILSHLSTKRKEFNSDRFRKIFERFDKMMDEVKMNIKFSNF